MICCVDALWWSVYGDCGFGLAAVGGVVLGFGLCSLIWYFRFLIYVAIVFEFSFIG